MSLALHGHHVLLIATLAFFTAVLTPNWYSSRYGEGDISINVFQICINGTSSSSSCSWTLSLPSDNPLSKKIKIVYPVLIASLAIACAGLSLIGLLLGSWYIKQDAGDNASRPLLVSIILIILFIFLLSCGVWTIMLTTNMQQQFDSFPVTLKELGFSFWINIGSSVGYLFALLIYLVAICKD